MKTLSIISAIIIVLVVSFCFWHIGKIVNYKLSYKSMVQETIREMVIDKCLKTKGSE